MESPIRQAEKSQKKFYVGRRSRHLKANEGLFNSFCLKLNPKKVFFRKVEK